MGAEMMGDDDLDTVFAAARAEGQAPSADLMARVLADAAALQPRSDRAAPTAAAAAPTAARPGVLASLAALFGGGPVLAGMCSAVMAGVFIGLAQPAPVLALTALLEGGQTSAALDVSSGIDALISEE